MAVAVGGTDPPVVVLITAELKELRLKTLCCLITALFRGCVVLSRGE